MARGRRRGEAKGTPLWRNAGWLAAIGAVLAALVPLVIYGLDRLTGDPASPNPPIDELEVAIAAVEWQSAELRVAGTYVGALGERRAIVVLVRPGEEREWTVASPRARTDADGTWVARIDMEPVAADVSAAVVDKTVVEGFVEQTSTTFVDGPTTGPPTSATAGAEELLDDLERHGPDADGVVTAEAVRVEP